MNETHGLDMLGQTGDAAPRTPSRKKAESGDFASQFMAMLFDDSPARTSAPSDRTGREKVPGTGAGGGRTSQGRSDQSGDASETSRGEKSSEKGTASETLFQISADMLARRVLSGSFGAGEAETATGSDNGQKRLTPEEDGEPDSSKNLPRPDADPETREEAGTRVEGGTSRGSGQSLDDLEREGEVHGKTETDRPGPHPEDADGLLRKTRDAKQTSSARPLRSEADVSAIGAKARDAVTGHAASTFGPSPSKTGSSEAGPFSDEKPQKAVPLAREDSVDSQRGIGDRRARVDRELLHTLQDAVGSRRTEAVGSQVDPAQSEAEEADRFQDAPQQRAHRSADETPGSAGFASRTADLNAARPTVLQGLTSGISHEARTRAGRTPHSSSVEATKRQDHRGGDPGTQRKPTTANTSPRAEVDSPGASHERTAGRHDSRFSSAGANHGNAQSSGGQETTREAAAQREVERSDAHRQEPELSRISRPSASRHETVLMKEGAQAGTDVLAGTPLKGDLAGSSIRSAGSHTPPAAATSPDFGRILNQIVSTARLERGAGLNRFTVQLKPDFLGRIEIQTELSDDAAVQAVIRVEDPSVRKAVEAGLGHLVHKLNELGLDITSAKVADLMPQNGGQGQQHSDPGSPGAKGGRHSGSSGRTFAGESDLEEGPIGGDDGSFSYFA